MTKHITPLNKHFDGYLPVVVDLETSGVNSRTDALLEIAAINIVLDEAGLFSAGESFSTHVAAFEGANFDEKALEINKIIPDHPFRFAIPESETLTLLFEFVQKALRSSGCRRAVLVGHNAHFDLGFLQAAMKRCGRKTSPFHAFTVFDTATLSGLAYGKTVLAKALKAAKIEFDITQAHSALYDTQKTTELFCKIMNNLKIGKQ